jgi:hypothetical protein
MKAGDKQSFAYSSTMKMRRHVPLNRQFTYILSYLECEYHKVLPLDDSYYYIFTKEVDS